MKKIYGGFLCLALAVAILLMPAKALAATSTTENTRATEGTELVIVDESTPLAPGEVRVDTHNIYVSIVVVGSLVIIGTALFLQHKKN